MPNIRQLTKRRKAVRNISTITRAMELIAAARFHRAQVRLKAAAPALHQAEQMLAELLALGPIDHPLLKSGRAGQVALLVLTADRGLCGGYNSRLLDAAVEAVEGFRRQGKTVRLDLVGRRGVMMSRYHRLAPEFGDAPLQPHDTFEGFEGAILFELVFELALAMAEDVTAGRLSEVHVLYSPIERPMQPKLVRLLPLEAPAGQSSRQERQYDFLPDAPAVIERLLGLLLRLRLFRQFLLAAASEQLARMGAMHSANTAAGKMIRALTMRINRVRQGQITRELAEIVGGAEAQV